MKGDSATTNDRCQSSVEKKISLEICLRPSTVNEPVKKEKIFSQLEFPQREFGNQHTFMLLGAHQSCPKHYYRELSQEDRTPRANAELRSVSDRDPSLPVYYRFPSHFASAQSIRRPVLSIGGFSVFIVYRGTDGSNARRCLGCRARVDMGSRIQAF